MTRGAFRCGATLLAATILAGCSVDAPEEPANPPQATDREARVEADRAEAQTREPMFLDQEDLEAYHRSTPERAVLELWFAVQYRDILAAYDLMADDFREEFARSLSHFSEFVMAEYPRWQARPRILFTHPAVNGGRTVVIDYRRPDTRTRERFAMTFVREEGDWKLAYDFYLSERLSAG